MTEKDTNIAEIAKKQRYSHLLKKMKSGKTLSTSQIKELEEYERMTKKAKKLVASPEASSVVCEEAPVVLSAQREIFCQAYIVSLNGKEAAIEAKYSKNTAEQQASRLLSNVNIKKRIAQLMRERENRTEIKADRVLVELSRIAFSNISDFLNVASGGITLKDFSKLPRELLACISEISEYETDRGRKRIKFKLHSKEKAIELAMRHLAMLTDNVNHNLPEGCGVLAVPIGMDKNQWLQFVKKQQGKAKKATS